MKHDHLNTIGGFPVFTLEGAVEAYKRLCARCFDNFTMEASVVLQNEAEKMRELGFSWHEIELIELQA